MIGWILPILAILWAAGLASYVLTEPEKDNRITPLSPEDLALWAHYRARDRDKLKRMKQDRTRQKRLWDEVNYPRAVWFYNARYIRTGKK